jgi:hypothetical protein
LYGQTAEAGAGRSVDLSDDGSVLAFGAPNTTVNGVFFAGKVSVFENQNNNWVQKGGDIDGDGTIVKFGESVRLSDDGNIIAIGQSGDPINNNPQDTGRVKIYQYINIYIIRSLRDNQMHINTLNYRMSQSLQRSSAVEAH